MTIVAKLVQVKGDINEAKDALARERANHAQTKASLTATKGHVTRQKRRASAGVCPCCNRSFQSLARHMKSQHPEYGS